MMSLIRSLRRRLHFANRMSFGSGDPKAWLWAWRTGGKIQEELNRCIRRDAAWSKMTHGLTDKQIAERSRALLIEIRSTQPQGD